MITEYSISLKKRIIDSGAINSKNHINSPKLRFLNKDLIHDIIQETKIFDELNPSLGTRISLILNDILVIPYCKNKFCSNICAYNNSVTGFFKTFCSCQCASEFARYDEETIRKYRIAQSTIECKQKCKDGAEKGRLSQIKKFGGAGFQRKDIQNKILNMDLSVKIKGRNKYFTFSNNRRVSYQGFEIFYFKEIDNYNQEFKILRSEVPHIKYIEDNKIRTYIPDLYHPTSNKIIEIKSPYTLFGDLDNIVRKISATIKCYDFNLIVFEKSGIKILDLFIPINSKIDDTVAILENFRTNNC